jgi:hypothetical protein
MSGAEWLALRGVLTDRRRALLDRLAVEAAGVKDDPDRLIEPGFLRLLSDIQTTIAAIDDELAAEGDAP